MGVFDTEELVSIRRLYLEKCVVAWCPLLVFVHVLLLCFSAAAVAFPYIFFSGANCWLCCGALYMNGNKIRRPGNINPQRDSLRQDRRVENTVVAR